MIIGVNSFTVLVDINTITAEEAAKASELSCDGIWFTTVNSPAGIDWKPVVAAIGGNTLAVSEDIHCCGPPVCPQQACFPPATTYADSLKAGCNVFGSFVYDEPKCTLNATELDSLLPFYNSRIIVHSRAWFPPHDQDIKDVIDHTGVVGVAFEANPAQSFRDVFKIPAGVAYVQANDLDVFILSPALATTTNYTGDVALMMSLLSSNPDVDMSSPNLRIVLAKYDTHMPFFGDPNNSIYGALQYLRSHPDRSRR